MTLSGQAERNLMRFSAPSFPSAVEAEKWWLENRETVAERIRAAGDLVRTAHDLYMQGRRGEAADAYDVAADACEELGWTKGLGDECRQSAWWCRDLARRDDLQRQAVGIACEHGFDACPTCDADRPAKGSP